MDAPQLRQLVVSLHARYKSQHAELGEACDRNAQLSGDVAALSQQLALATARADAPDKPAADAAMAAAVAELTRGHRELSVQLAAAMDESADLST
jgi:hypothetical protein